MKRITRVSIYAIAVGEIHHADAPSRCNNTVVPELTFLHLNIPNLQDRKYRLTLFFCACIMESEMQERREYIENHNSRKPEH